jgi:hypothetical protein
MPALVSSSTPAANFFMHVQHHGQQHTTTRRKGALVHIGQDLDTDGFPEALKVIVSVE